MIGRIFTQVRRVISSTHTIMTTATTRSIVLGFTPIRYTSVFISTHMYVNASAMRTISTTSGAAGGVHLSADLHAHPGNDDLFDVEVVVLIFRVHFQHSASFAVSA